MMGLAVVGCWLVGASGAGAQSPAFTQVAGSPFPTGTFPYSVAFSRGGGLLATADQGATPCRCSRSTRAPAC